MFELLDELEFEQFEQFEQFELFAGKNFELESSAYPGISCVTPGNPYVLHCFPAFKTELTRDQHKHLDIIAGKIRRSYSTSRPVTKVVIYGHSSTWHEESRSDLERRALERANNAREQLIRRLQRMRLANRVAVAAPVGRSDTKPWLGRSYSSTSGTRQAQNDRALNRRVEIFLVKSSAPPPPPEPLSPKESLWRMRPPVRYQRDRYICWAAAISSWSLVTKGAKKFKTTKSVLDFFRPKGVMNADDSLILPDGMEEVSRVFSLKFKKFEGGGSLSAINIGPLLKHSHLLVVFRRPDATYHHFVVVYGVDRFHICFMDPELNPAAPDLDKIKKNRVCARIDHFGAGATEFFVFWK
jgi:hypothetical protein